ncbi:MAG: hypothetical protein RSB59_05845 [Clostridia bacterium]
MSKFVACFMIVVIILSLFAVLTGSGSTFSVKDYLNGLSNPPQKPTPPTEPTWGDMAFFDKVGNGFKFVGQCLWYPFEYIAYMFQTVAFFFKGVKI